ncbi:MAG TPA: Holliday junction DNA helicase RuvB C-terminal domain-containing protein, partial [Gaiellaceae bacterium]|nr:Holliday junction DNA helicase RuvB C-terminal domain-containing protein [Gaiellaceae bacterium]
RGTPRVANRILRRVRVVAEVRHDGAVTLAGAREALELLVVDAEGLERTDRELLSAIAHKFDGGPVGLSTLAVALGEEPETIEDVYEPYLLQLGLLQRTPRGRVLTELGRERAGAAPRVDESLFEGSAPAASSPGADGIKTVVPPCFRADRCYRPRRLDREPGDHEPREHPRALVQGLDLPRLRAGGHLRPEQQGRGHGPRDGLPAPLSRTRDPECERGGRRAASLRL